MTVTAPTDATRRFNAPRPKVPAFARYVGTSAWRKDRRRAREYARYLAAEKLKGHSAAVSAG